jgi:MoxR-like ATPase
MEAMAEGKVSVDGTTYELAKPFFVLATMNPIERFGSFDLPESQLDRFMMSISLGYPDRTHELEILARDMEHAHADELRPVTDPKMIRQLQQEVRGVRVEASVMDYLLDLVAATREDHEVRLGLSSRGALHLKRAMQAMALLGGRDYVIPEDLRRVFVPVCVHRVFVSGSSVQGTRSDDKKRVLNRILISVEGPV